MSDGPAVIDAWMQHPGQRWIDDATFASPRRWKPGPFSETAPPLEVTVETMDAAGVERAMLCAWHGPTGPMISNAEVAEACATYPDRFVGVASVDLTRPMTAVAEPRPAANSTSPLPGRAADEPTHSCAATR